MKGPELKKTRHKLGLSLADVSRQLEVSARTIARWEAQPSDIPAWAEKLFRLVNKIK